LRKKGEGKRNGELCREFVKIGSFHRVNVILMAQAYFLDIRRKGVLAAFFILLKRLLSLVLLPLDDASDFDHD
jgi:hypothetical protein